MKKPKNKWKINKSQDSIDNCFLEIAILRKPPKKKKKKRSVRKNNKQNPYDNETTTQLLEWHSWYGRLILCQSVEFHHIVIVIAVV
jgi:hypothetical protein